MVSSLFKSFLLLLFVSATLSGCSEPPSAPSDNSVGSDKGQQAADFTLPNIQGQAVTLSDLQGKVVILNFWATWCPPCREEMPSMEKLYRQYKDQGLVVLAVNVEEDGAAPIQRLLQRTPYSFPILLDDDAEIQSRYNVFSLPGTFIIDRNGKVVEKVIGAIDWTSGATYKLITSLLND